MQEIDVRALKRQQSQDKNLLGAILAGKDRKGLTCRLVELTDETRTRGGKNSRRRTARVWRPVTITQPSDS